MKTKPKTVLVVDDDANTLKAVSVRLNAAGYQVRTASNGVEALVMARTQAPDAIIADIWMPVGMGFSLAHRLRETAPEIPIIFLTADKQSGLKDMAREVGAAGFLEKPYSPEILLAMVSWVLTPPPPARCGLASAN